jgi:hypothetical protein
MQKIYATALILAPLFCSAQQRTFQVNGHSAPTAYTKGVSYFSESFDSGLNGWTAETTLGVVDWKWTSSGPGPTASTYPVPVLATSTPSGWAIIDDDFDGVSGQSSDASLISPVIDLSSAPTNLRVRFDQYFQEFQADACFVGVSTDGGLTWNETEVNAGVGREGRPNPEQVEVTITTWVAANPANVQLRFRYTSTWDYGWQVDNIQIVEQFAFDLIAGPAFFSHSLSDDEYGRVPVSQLSSSMRVGGQVLNDGFQAQTNVEATISVVNSGGTPIFNSTANWATLAPNATVTMDNTPAIPALQPDIYTATYTVTSDENESDALPTNNTRERRFAITSDRYALDGIGVHGTTPVLGSVGTNSFDGGEDGLKVMVYYPVTAPLTVYGIEFLLAPNSVLGGYVQVSIHDTTDMLAVPAVFDQPLVESDAYDIQQTDLTSGTVTVEFNEPYVLPPGNYFGAVTLFSQAGTGTLRIVDDLTVPQPPITSAIYIPEDRTYTNTNAAAVRLITSGPIGIDENDLASPSIRLFPNPTWGLVSVDAGTKTTEIVELHDARGRLVYTALVNGTTQLDLGQLEAGVYAVSISRDGIKRTERLIIQ